MRKINFFFYLLFAFALVFTSCSESESVNIEGENKTEPNRTWAVQKPCDATYPNCFNGSATVVKDSTPFYFGLSIGISFRVLPGEICEFQSFGNVVIQYYSSNIGVVYY